MDRDAYFFKLEERDEALDPRDDDARCIVSKEWLKHGEQFRMCKFRHVISIQWCNNSLNDTQCAYCANYMEPYVYTNTGPGPSDCDDGAGPFNIEG